MLDVQCNDEKKKYKMSRIVSVFRNDSQFIERERSGRILSMKATQCLLLFNCSWNFLTLVSEWVSVRFKRVITKRAWMWEIKQIRLLIRASCLVQLFDSIHCCLRLLQRLYNTLVGSSMFNVCIFLFNLILYSFLFANWSECVFNFSSSSNKEKQRSHELTKKKRKYWK